MTIEYNTVIYAILGIMGIFVLISNQIILLYLLVFTTVFSSIFSSPLRFGFINVYMYDMILFFYIILVIIKIFFRIMQKQKLIELQNDSNLIIILIFSYIFLHFLYVLSAINDGIPIDNTLRRFSNYAGIFFFFFPAYFLYQCNRYRKLLYFIVVISVIVPFWQIYNFMSADDWQWATTSSGTVRLGVGGIPILACAIFTVLIFKTTLKHYLVVVPPMISMALTGHRSVLLALVMSLIMYLILKKNYTKSLLFVYLFSFLFIFGLLSVEVFTGHSFVNDLVKRGKDTFNLENPTTVDRLNKIENNWRTFKHFPFMGIGYKWESLKKLFGHSIDANAISKDAIRDVIHPHNFLLRSLSHTGVLGTLILSIIIFLVIKKCYLLTLKNDDVKNAGIFLLCSLSFFIIMALMNTTFAGEGWIFWLLCGVSVTVEEIKHQSEQNIGLIKRNVRMEV